MLFIFISLLSHFHLTPEKHQENSALLLTRVRKPQNTHVNSIVKMRCGCCDHLTVCGCCPGGQREPRWRGESGELTGLLDCSMSLRSHIFRRRSRSFSSCSLVLRSLSSFLSLSSVASISDLQYTAEKNKTSDVKSVFLSILSSFSTLSVAALRTYQRGKYLWVANIYF